MPSAPIPYRYVSNGSGDPTRLSIGEMLSGLIVVDPLEFLKVLGIEPLGIRTAESIALIGVAGCSRNAHPGEGSRDPGRSKGIWTR